MSWDIDVSEKLYQRLANEIFFRILHGKYRTGDKMPSYTELAKEAGSSPETVRKAFRELQHYGVIEKMRRGYFVTADEAVVMAYRQQYLTTIEKKYLVAKAKVEIRNINIKAILPRPTGKEKNRCGADGFVRSFHQYALTAVLNIFQSRRIFAKE